MDMPSTCLEGLADAEIDVNLPKRRGYLPRSRRMSLVNAMFETTVVNVGCSGARAARRWLRTASPPCHLGQQVILAFSARDEEGTGRVRYGVFEGADGRCVEISRSIPCEAGWSDVGTLTIGGTRERIAEGIAETKRIAVRVTDRDSRRCVDLLVATMEARLAERP